MAERMNRVKLHAYFGVAALTLPLISSMVAIALSGSRGYAGLGPFMTLPIIQVVYSLFFVKRPVYLAIFTAVLISIISHYLSMAAVESKVFSLGIDHYGYFDLLAIYVVVSIVLWEIAHAFVSKFNNENAI